MFSAGTSHASAGFYKKLQKRNWLNLSFAGQPLQELVHTKLDVERESLAWWWNTDLLGKPLSISHAFGNWLWSLCLCSLRWEPPFGQAEVTQWGPPKGSSRLGGNTPVKDLGMCPSHGPGDCAFVTLLSP